MMIDYIYKGSPIHLLKAAVWGFSMSLWAVTALKKRVDYWV